MLSPLPSSSSQPLARQQGQQHPPSRPQQPLLPPQVQPEPRQQQQVRDQQPQVINQLQHSSSSITETNSASDSNRRNPLQRFGVVIQPSQCPAGYRRDCVNKSTCFFRHIGEKVGDPVPKEEWSVVSRKRKPPLFGSKRGTESTIAGQRTIREISIFVGGVNNRLTVEDFSEHVKDNLGVTPINVAQNKCNNYNQSFKLTIRSSDKDKIFNPEMWEENIIIKPFRERRHPDNEQNETNRRDRNLDMYAFQNFTPL